MDALEVAFVANPDGGGYWIVEDDGVVIFRSVDEQGARDYVDMVLSW